MPVSGAFRRAGMAIPLNLHHAYDRLGDVFIGNVGKKIRKESRTRKGDREDIEQLYWESPIAEFDFASTSPTHP
jgi:hypothetical protein